MKSVSGRNISKIESLLNLIPQAIRSPQCFIPFHERSQLLASHYKSPSAGPMALAEEVGHSPFIDSPTISL